MRLPRTPPPPVPPTVVGKLTSCSPSGNTAWPDSENPETAAGSGGLSGLAIAGIVVGVLLTIMQLAVLFYCLFRAEGHRLVDPICVGTAETVAEKAYNPSASITRDMATRPTRTTWQLNHEQPAANKPSPETHTVRISARNVVKGPGHPTVSPSELPMLGHASPPRIPAPALDRGQSPSQSTSNEIARLVKKKARVEERRRRLRELEMLDSEADAIDERLGQLRGQSGRRRWMAARILVPKGRPQ